MTTSDSSPSSDLSPKLQERRKAREDRDRPWRWGSKEFPDLTPPPPPDFRVKLTIRGRYSNSFPTKPFPFTKLPFDCQVLIAEFAAQFKTKIKVSEFLPSTDPRNKWPNIPRPPKKTLNCAGQPTYIPFSTVFPYLLPELSRAWYSQNTFYIKSVPEFDSLTHLAGPSNMNRIRHLQVENTLIYCKPSDLVNAFPDPTPYPPSTLAFTFPGTITQPAPIPTANPFPTRTMSMSWRSHSLLTPLKSLRTLTLHRDDGGPVTFTDGGNDEFNSVEWFRELVRGSKSLRRIQFALYRWSEFGRYELEKSNMVAWIKEWEVEWDGRLKKRRGADEEKRRSRRGEMGFGAAEDQGERGAEGEDKKEKEATSWYLVRAPPVQGAAPGSVL